MGDYRKSAMWIMGKLRNRLLRESPQRMSTKIRRAGIAWQTTTDCTKSLADLAADDNRRDVNCAYHHESLGNKTLRCDKQHRNYERNNRSNYVKMCSTTFKNDAEFQS